MHRFVFSLALWPALALAGTPPCEPLPESSLAALPLELTLQRAAACHPAVRAAEQALAGSRADLLTARQRPNPQLGLGAASIGRNLGAGSVWNKSYDQQARIDQLVERGGKPQLREATAEAALQAMLAELQDVRRQAQREAARGHLDLAAAVALKGEAQVAVNLIEQSLQALALRVKAGDAAPLDASRLEVEALRARAELRQAEAEAEKLRVQLALWIGAPAQAARLQPQASALAPALPSATHTPDEDARLVEARPDVAAAARRVEASRRALDLAEALKVRDVTVGLQLDRFPGAATNPIATGNTASVFVSVPLFVRHRHEGEAARAAADLGASEEALQRTRSEAASEVRQLRLAYEAARQRRSLIAEQLIPRAVRVADGAELAYRRGALGVIDLLDARRNLRAAHVERIQAEAELARAAVELDLALAPRQQP